MSKNRLSIDFKGFEDYAEKLDRLAGGEELKKAVEEALTETKDMIHKKLHVDMKRHHRTGETEESLKDDSKVEWSGMTAQIGVGFDISHGGFASIFLLRGTPRMAKDQKLYNDIYGSATKRKARQLQEKVFAEAIEKAGL